MSPTADTEDAALLSRTITATGLTIEKFAAHILARDARSVYRWLDGQQLPHAVRAKCLAVLWELEHR